MYCFYSSNRRGTTLEQSNNACARSFSWYVTSQRTFYYRRLPFITAQYRLLPYITVYYGILPFSHISDALCSRGHCYVNIIYNVYVNKVNKVNVPNSLMDEYVNKTTNRDYLYCLRDQERFSLPSVARSVD